MPSYHINPKTGKPGICNAKVRGCTFSKEGLQHYPSKQVAEQEIAKNILYKQYRETGYNAILPSKYVDIERTFGVGSFNMSFDALVSKIGEPTHGASDKTQVEWHFNTPYGPASIYDWKQDISPEYVGTWDVGARDYKALDWIQAQLYKPTPNDAFR